MAEPTDMDFLKKCRSEIIQHVRNVNSLVDFLRNEKILTKEMASTILAEKKKEDQMREVYSHLNSERAQQLMLEWMQKEEPDLLKDMKKRHDSDNYTLPNKRLRYSEEGVDEIGGDVNQLSLKTLLTFAKLENWVSKNSQRLIEKLENKLASGQMERLEKYLKDKKLKKGLHFHFSDIRKVESNQSLQSFLSASNNAKFPGFTLLDIFFEKNRDHVSPKKYLKEKDEDLGDNESNLNSIGYGSLTNSDFGHDEQKATENEPKNTDVLFESKQRVLNVAKQSQDLHTALDVVMHVQTQHEQAHFTAQEESEGPQMTGQEFPDTSFQNISASWHRQAFNSTSLNNNMQTAAKAKSKCGEKQNQTKIHKTALTKNFLYKWAKKECRSEEAENIKTLFDSISIENQVEHGDYPCFIAEDVMVYKNLKTGISQIIVVEKKNTAKTKLSKETKSLLNYQMWVRGIYEAVLIKEEHEEIKYDSAFQVQIDRCEQFVQEAFAPALAVFKKIQRQERLYSLLENH